MAVVMTPSQFRQLALSFPEATETDSANDHSFRVQGQVFATLFPDDGWGVVKMTPELQAELVREFPTAFETCKGAWGRNGATVVFLNEADEAGVFRALADAWQKHAPTVE